ncbi:MULTISPECIES: hypothetical protein [unclassified Halomonas]|uniref:hypothetical protein n=1 Tax=unclassified Halomonas TaxID=2609666 RepID=UPI0007D91641|nr:MULTISPECIES: hypothetical protein [unclassified Halomonas]MBT2788639.1 hypothetical protein [Halomonas sp. ISL-106]MBT2798230.1 hypothetical protein [Halomonas sp. ISL-104]OAL60779.1 hypothetical protein A6R74_18885 [Halomonas sp. ALS9]
MKQLIIERSVISALRALNYSIQVGGKSKIVADMSALIEATSKLPLTNFDYWEHLIRAEYSEAFARPASPKWMFWSKPMERFTWLDLISGDGYRREKTLRALTGAAPNAFFLSLAVRRMNDWVPQVREAAREKLPFIVNATDPHDAAEALCIVLSSWHSWGRIEDADKQVLLQIISEGPIAEFLIAQIKYATSGPMPSLLAQLGRTAILDDRLEDIAEQSIQPAVRAKAYRSLFEGRITWVEERKWQWTNIRDGEGGIKEVVSERALKVNTPLHELLRNSAEDRSSIVRRVSAEILIRELATMGSIAKELAEKFASDKSSPVAERGQFAIKKLKNVEDVDIS